MFSMYMVENVRWEYTAERKRNLTSYSKPQFEEIDSEDHWQGKPVESHGIHRKA